MSDSSHGREIDDDSPQISPHYCSDTYDDEPISWKIRKIERPDRLSALTDPLVLHILSYLRMEEVRRTAILSKRWRLLWTSAHNLVFRCTGKSHYSVTAFITSVDDTLLLSKPNKLNKFSVEFRYNKKLVKCVNKWMLFVHNKYVEELELYLMTRGSDNFYNLPQILYSNACFREMSLCNCNLVPKEGINWPSLKVLVIRKAELNSDIVDAICSGCPSLESLKFSMCYGVNLFKINSKSVKKLVISGYWQQVHDELDDDNDAELIIDARNITSLEIEGCFHKKIVLLENVSALVHAKLDFFRTTDDYESYHSDFKIDEDMLRDLLVLLGDVEKLSVGSWCLQVLNMIETKNSSCPRMRCKDLTLNSRLTNKEFPGLAILLQSCPLVEVLNISDESAFEEYSVGWSFTWRTDEFSAKKYWITRPCWVLNLKTLRIDSPWIYEILYFEYISTFLQAVLKNGLVLQKVILPSFTDRTWISPRRHTIVAEMLLSFPRSSKDAVILFSG
ncbi:putative F-box/LRR-repeat protein At5g02930 isoform X1 [Solanum pennellii]|uniref:F-box/LRR-repeat protein At5g02930 isoform X1 n=1 Tax=Solanum pennellii TaxID=28526 RepID=A0ABM1G2U1_SOLPN|nr:putative F-box/LRR-repeat protein At5g02930 isoform X1 [Solanum pennellii]